MMDVMRGRASAISCSASTTTTTCSSATRSALRRSAPRALSTEQRSIRAQPTAALRRACTPRLRALADRAVAAAVQCDGAARAPSEPAHPSRHRPRAIHVAGFWSTSTPWPISSTSMSRRLASSRFSCTPSTRSRTSRSPRRGTTRSAAWSSCTASSPSTTIGRTASSARWISSRTRSFAPLGARSARRSYRPWLRIGCNRARAQHAPLATHAVARASSTSRSRQRRRERRERWRRSLRARARARSQHAVLGRNGRQGTRGRMRARTVMWARACRMNDALSAIVGACNGVESRSPTACSHTRHACVCVSGLRVCELTCGSARQLCPRELARSLVIYICVGETTRLLMLCLRPHELTEKSCVSSRHVYNSPNLSWIISRA